MDDNKYIDEDEITLRELILKFQEFYREVVKNWVIVVFITLLSLLFMFYKSYKAPVTFPASLTFMVDEDQGGGLGALGGLASSFGLGGSGSEYNLEKIQSLLKSRNIVEQALFEKTTINGENDFFANHLIKEYEYHEEIWNEDTTGLKDFLYSHHNLTIFKRYEYNALKQLHGQIVGNPEKDIDGILSTGLNDDTGIMTMSISSTSEDLSIALVKKLYEKLSKFYIDKTIEKQKQTFEITKSKVDSIHNLINSSQYQLLKLQDTQKNLRLKQFEFEELRLRGLIQSLTYVYGEALKNQEIADFSLKNKTPFIQFIDSPIPPIKSSKTLMTYIINLIIGGFLGVFLSVGFIMIRKQYRDLMS